MEQDVLDSIEEGAQAKGLFIITKGRCEVTTLKAPDAEDSLPKEAAIKLRSSTSAWRGDAALLHRGVPHVAVRAAHSRCLRNAAR